MTRPRLTFACSDGATILEGAPGNTAIELLLSFVEDRLYFGCPPYVVTVEDVPIDTPYVTSITDGEAA